MSETIDNIKVEISLGDLIELKNLICYYKNTDKRHAKYLARIAELEKEIIRLEKLNEDLRQDYLIALEEQLGGFLSLMPHLKLLDRVWLTGWWFLFLLVKTTFPEAF